MGEGSMERLRINGDRCDNDHASGRQRLYGFAESAGTIVARVWNWVEDVVNYLPLVGCRHRDTVFDTRVKGVLRLRCMDCNRVTGGVKYGQ